jgi:hypothetical protein
MFAHIYNKVIGVKMSGMTDRIANQNMIELAKKQYELDKRKSMPGEIMQLVSNGMVYPKDHPLRSGTIEMRYMTAYDEDILTNPSYLREGIVLDKLLQTLIITPVDYSTIAKIDKNGLIIAARILSYGKEYPVTIKDPKTGNELNRTVDLSQLKNSEFNLMSNDLGEFEYSVNTGTNLKFKFLLNGEDVDLTISQFLERTITQVNESRKHDDIQDFIRYKFLAKDAKLFRKYIIEHTPNVVMDYEFEGEDGGAFTAGFPIGADLFWF